VMQSETLFRIFPDEVLAFGMIQKDFDSSASHGYHMLIVIHRNRYLEFKMGLIVSGVVKL
jgi:hypothetical protein